MNSSPRVKKFWDETVLLLTQQEAAKILKIIEIQERINRLDNRLNEVDTWRTMTEQKRETTPTPTAQINGGKNKKNKI